MATCAATCSSARCPTQNASEMKADYGELSLQLRTAKSAYGDGFAEARIRYGLQGDAAGHVHRPARGLRQRVPRPVRPAARQADHRVGARRRAQPDQQPDAGRLPHPLAARGRHPPRQRRRARVPAPGAGAPGRRLDADLPRHRAAAGRAAAGSWRSARPTFPSPTLRNGLGRRARSTWSWPRSRCRSRTCAATRRCPA